MLKPTSVTVTTVVGAAAKTVVGVAPTHEHALE